MRIVGVHFQVRTVVHLNIVISRHSLNYVGRRPDEWDATSVDGFFIIVRAIVLSGVKSRLISSSGETI